MFVAEEIVQRKKNLDIAGLLLNWRPLTARAPIHWSWRVAGTLSHLNDTFDKFYEGFEGKDLVQEFPPEVPAHTPHCRTSTLPSLPNCQELQIVLMMIQDPKKHKLVKMLRLLIVKYDINHS